MRKSNTYRNVTVGRVLGAAMSLLLMGALVNILVGRTYGLLTNITANKPSVLEFVSTFIFVSWILVILVVSFALSLVSCLPDGCGRSERRFVICLTTIIGVAAVGVWILLLVEAAYPIPWR